MGKSIRFLNIGHRGAAAYARENTIASFEEAISRNADMIEYDVRRTADGVLVVYHDRTIRTGWGRGPISKLSFEQVQEAARTFGFSVNKFADVMKRFGAKIPMNIEIKARGFESEVLTTLEKAPPAFPPVVSSFLPWVVGQLKDLHKDLATGLIIGREQTYKFGFLSRPILKTLTQGLGINSLHLQESIIDSRTVKKAHDLGLKIYAWTVDDEFKMRELIELRVDGIITNRPDALHTVCRELAAEKQPAIRRVSGGMGKYAFPA